MSSKMTTEEFIKKARQVHGDKYDYSKVEYVGSEQKVCIICPEHGEFWQSAHGHLNGYGCPICSKIRGGSLRRKTNQDFIERARKTHGNKYDYSKTEYKKAKNSVIITCPKHGDFLQSPDSHIKGAGCPKCKKERIASLKRKTTKWFLQKAVEIHGNRYDYSKVNYVDAKTKVCIICKKHGEFWQIPDSHIKGHGCMKCNTEGKTKYNREICITTARTCDSRVEFAKKYPGMVECAKRNGWYEECCSHMSTRGSKQRIIYAYEFKESHAAYIGLTFKMKVRDKRHHKEGAVYEYANLHGIEIPMPKVLTDYMEQKEAAIQEGVWLQKYKDEGWIIINKLKTGSLGGQELLDYSLDKIEKSMLGYKKMEDWSRKHGSYRDYISNNNLDYLLDKYFPNRMKRKYDDYEACRKAYSLCKSISEVHDRFPGAIAAAKRHGWYKELSNLCRASNVKWTREKCIEVISGYKTLKEFKTNHNGAYQMIKRKGWNDLLEPLTRQLHSHYKFTIEDIKTICDKAGDYKTLKAIHPEILNFCWHNDIDIYKMMGWRKSNLRPIRLLKDGVIVKTFQSAKAAANYLGIGDRHLGRYIDKNIEYHGYVWETDN